uniref:TSA: Wollemia nobilis Ref_Wollemi_Transcript_8310_1194 transcribed RNA sequence n=1 Tax=Wollemia nobilis TaxID=56998 RepID=A0A0C9RNI0_9CONI
MGASEYQRKKSASERWKLFGSPFRKKQTEDTQPIVYDNNNNNNDRSDNSNGRRQTRSLVSVARATLLTWRRLRLNPDKKLFFLYEPGKQVSSAVRIKNVSRSYVAFKFQTNAPKSCFMRPPHGILAPKQSILASVVKFVEQPEHPQEKKPVIKDKFKIVSLKVKEGTEYSADLFEEHRDFVLVERVLRVVFLDPERPSKELEKLKKRLEEAEAIKQAQKKPQEDNKEAKPAPEGIIDEWKERREKYLARQQEEVVESF